jgi:hypothetical protein
VSPLAALLCALLLPTAHAQEWSEFNRPYLETAVSLLKRLPATREHWRFVQKERIPLEVTDNPSHVDDNTLGAYDMVERHINIDEVELIRAAEGLVDDGVSTKTTAEVLAWKSLPVLVHELTHGMIHDRVWRLFGRPFVFPSLEDEKLAFYDECLALFDMFDEKPELWSRERILEMDKTQALVLKAWLRGPTGLEALVTDLYEGRPSLLVEKDEPLRLIAERRAASLRRSIAAMREASRAATDYGPEMAGVSQRFLADLPQALEHAEKSLKLVTAAQGILADPESLKRLKAFYRTELEARRAKLEARRPRDP